MNMVNIVDIKKNFKKYLLMVSQGITVTVMRRNIPVALLSPIPGTAPNRTKLGSGLGSAQIHGDLTEPFIAEEDWEMLR